MKHTNKERIKFLTDCVSKDAARGTVFSAERKWDNGWTDTIVLFTIPTQHIQGKSLTEVLDKGIDMVANKKKK